MGRRLLAQQYGVGCHNDYTLLGNLSLETFDVAAAHERAETAEKTIGKLRALVETLETVVDGAFSADPNPGTRRFQRLNRAEYERVVEDLLALEVDASRWLPADTYLGNFDNMSAAQRLSTTLLETYMRAASEVRRLAVGNPSARSRTAKYTNPIELSQHAWDHIGGAPYGTRGGIVVTHDFPRPESPGDERPCAERIVSRLAREAYRRPVTAEDLAGAPSIPVWMNGPTS